MTETYEDEAEAFLARAEASAQRWLGNDGFRAELDQAHQKALEQPCGYIECDGELMGFWLPEDVNPDDLELDWVGS